MKCSVKNDIVDSFKKKHKIYRKLVRNWYVDMLFYNRISETNRLRFNTKKVRASHRKVSCPFCVSDDFAEVSRIVDVGGVTEIVPE